MRHPNKRKSVRSFQFLSVQRSHTDVLSNGCITVLGVLSVLPLQPTGGYRHVENIFTRVVDVSLATDKSHSIREGQAEWRLSLMT